MNNADVLMEIALKLGNETLSNLVLPELWDTLAIVLSNDLFWLRRCEIELRTSLQDVGNLQWKRVYNTIVYKRYDYVAAIDLLLQLNVKLEIEWEDVKSPEVLEYLLARNMLQSDIEDKIQCLRSACSENLHRLVMPLLDLIDSEVDEAELSFDEKSDLDIEIGECLEVAAGSGSLLALKELENRVSLQHDSELTVLTAAIEGGHKHIVRYIAQYYELADIARLAAQHDAREILYLAIELDEDATLSLQDLFWEAIEAGAVDCIELLLSYDNYDAGLEWSNILEDVVLQQHHALLRWILARDSHVEITIELLLTAAAQSDLHCLEILLAAKQDITLVQLLLAHTDLDTNNLKPAHSRLMLEILGISSSTIRYAVADTLHGLTLRYMLLRRPNRAELADWMIAQNNIHFSEAARDVLENISLSLTADAYWIRALLRAMLYPQLAKYRNRDISTTEGAREPDLDAVLIALQVYESTRRN
ncbi:Hypothetical protein POVR2_LOCUS128 [uncultured virus]|nr:Hypothetical protein POVR2_LOCUS128 [uncultured virus]